MTAFAIRPFVVSSARTSRRGSRYRVAGADSTGPVQVVDRTGESIQNPCQHLPAMDTGVGLKLWCRADEWL